LGLFYKVVFPIFTLLVGAFISFGINWLLESRRIRLIKKYLIYSINNLIKVIDIQIPHFEDVIAKIHSEISYLLVEPGFHVNNLESISKYDTFKIIVLNGFKNKEIKRKLFNDYNDSLESIKIVEQHSKDEINNLFKSEKNNIVTFNNYYYELQDTINRKMKKYNEQNKNDRVVFDQIEIVNEKSTNRENELTEKIIEINKIFLKDLPEDTNIYYYEEKLVNPLFNLAKEYNDLDFSHIIPPIVNIINAIKNTREAIKERFEIFKSNLENSKSKLKNVNDLLLNVSSNN
jgi:hypothetical protein